MESIITVRNLTKQYYDKNKPSLNSVDLDLSAGQIIGIMGSKGSGKSTLLRVLASLCPSYKGDVFINKKPLGKQTKKLVSYLPETSVYPEEYTCQNVIDFFVNFYKDFRKIIMEGLLFKFQIDPKVKYSTLTPIQKKLFDLGLCISRDVPIYLLDEPLNIDSNENNIYEFIFDTIMSTCSKTALIMISSTKIYNIENYCNTVVFFKDGKVILIGQPHQLIKQHDMSISQLYQEVTK